MIRIFLSMRRQGHTVEDLERIHKQHCDVIRAVADGDADRATNLVSDHIRTSLQERLDEFDHIEINEAFAAQVLACTRSLGLADDAEHVNSNGGAIALGHPLGASGARLAMSAAYALRRERQSRALVSLCVGVGQGVALALERA